MQKRTFFTKIGFVLSVAGGAVGLGNAWKFPTLTAQNGGFAFVLLYLFFTLSIGLCVFLAELALGRLARADLATAFEKMALRGKKFWVKCGVFMLGGIFVLSFYLMIMAWVLKYMVFSLFTLPSDIQSAANAFNTFVSSELTLNVIFYLIAFFLTLFVVSKGLIAGIERLNVIIMPTLFIMLLLMLTFCLRFDGFSQAFAYLFKPNFANFSVDSVLSALGLAFFTLCVGIGCIATYAASIDERTNFISSALFIVFINILIALMMGLIVFTFIFEFAQVPKEQGAGLVFVSLMGLFSNFGALGHFLAFYFFLALFFAGITSAVSMIEPLVFYFTKRRGFERTRALRYIGVLVLLLGLACVLSLNSSTSAYFSLGGKDFFTLLDFFASNVVLPLGVLCICVFVGFFAPKDAFLGLLGRFMSEKACKIWLFSLRYLCPILIIFVGVYQILMALK